MEVVTKLNKELYSNYPACIQDVLNQAPLKEFSSLILALIVVLVLFLVIKSIKDSLTCKQRPRTTERPKAADRSTSPDKRKSTKRD